MSPDTSADKSDAPELRTSTADTTDPAMTALFLDALTRHGGSVPKARTDMTQTGHRPPSRGYAYQLRKTWTQQAAASSHLTGVR